MSTIIRAAKISTNIIQQGQDNIYGFTISVHSAEGEFTATNYKNIDTASLSINDKKIVDDFIALMALKLTEN